MLYITGKYIYWKEKAFRISSLHFAIFPRIFNLPMTKSSTLPELGNVIYSRANSTYSSLNGNESSTAVQHDLTELLEALDELRALVLGPRSYIYYTLILSVSISHRI